MNEEMMMTKIMQLVQDNLEKKANVVEEELIEKFKDRLTRAKLEVISELMNSIMLKMHQEQNSVNYIIQFKENK